MCLDAWSVDTGSLVCLRYFYSRLVFSRPAKMEDVSAMTPFAELAAQLREVCPERSGKCLKRGCSELLCPPHGVWPRPWPVLHH